MSGRIENKVILRMLMKDVFGSMLLDSGKWPMWESDDFRIGRTYFYDRSKRDIPINRTASEKLELVYRFALTEGSGCSYDPGQISRKLCEVLEELVTEEDFRFLKFQYGEPANVREIKRRALLSIVELVCQACANRQLPDLERLRERYSKELKPSILEQLLTEGCTQKSENVTENRTPQKVSIELSFQSPYGLEDTMIYPDSFFVGRESELFDMHGLLSASNNKLFLTGMGGIGKSELARQYVTRFRADYERILWVSATGTLVHTITDDYLFPIRGLSRLDYPKDSDLEYFLRKCRILKEIAGRETLIVVDNYDGEEETGLWDFLEGMYAVLFTTRISRKNSRLREIKILPLADTEELLCLFQKEYGRNMDAVEISAQKELIALLGGHTLSLRLCASILRHRRILPSEMVDSLRKNQSTDAFSVARAQEEIQEGIRQIFSVACLDREEQFLLKNLVCVPLTGISAVELFDWCEYDNYDVLEGLIRKNLVVHYPSTDEVHLHPVISSVMRKQILEEDPDVKILLRNLSYLTVEMRRASFSEKERLLSFAEHIASLNLAGNEARRNSLIILSQMYSHFSRYAEAEQLLSEAMVSCDPMAERMNILHRRSQLKTYMGDVEESRELAFQGLRDIAQTEAMGGEYDPVLGHWKIEFNVRIAEGYRHLGDLDLDALYCQKALAAADAVYGGMQGEIPRRPFTLLTWDWKRFGKKQAMNKRGAGHHLRTLLPEQDYGWLNYHLGESYLARQDTRAAEICARKAISCFVSVEDVWAEIFGHNLLGHVLCLEGRTAEALEELLQAYEGYAPMNGKFAIGGMLAFLIFLYRQCGDAQGAECIIQEAREKYPPAGMEALLLEAKALEAVPWTNPTALTRRLEKKLQECAEEADGI